MSRNPSPSRLAPFLKTVLLSIALCLLSLAGSTAAPRDLPAGTCADPIPIGCGWTVQGDTRGKPSNITAYACQGWDESGPEQIYEFTLPPGATYDVTATISGMTEDLDIFLVSDCAAASCMQNDSFGNSTATASGAQPGSYYVAVDGYAGAADSYQLELGCTPVGGSQFTVDSNADGAGRIDTNWGDGICDDGTGHCPLRAAIQEANASAGPDLITFAPSATGMHIVLDSAQPDLPDLTEQAMIDASANWLMTENRPGVRLDGSDEMVNGLTFKSGGCGVFGMHISGMTGAGVMAWFVDGVIGGPGPVQGNLFTGNHAGVHISGHDAQRNLVQNNIIGLDHTRTIKQPNTFGVMITGGASQNTIGGSALVLANTISGNDSDGVYMNQLGTHSNTVSGNWIGPSGNGQTLLGNGGAGVHIVGGANSNTVGGSWIVLPNVIAGNGTHGVSIESGGGSDHVAWNDIGLNAQNGIDIRNSSSTIVAQNLIHGNGQVGVRIGGDRASSNSLVGNGITANGGKGIELWGGANGGRTPPVITAVSEASAPPVVRAASATGASGTTCPNCSVEVFSDDADEGKTSHALVAADAGGNWSYSGPLDGPFITATTSDANGNTSEFSAPKALSAPPTATSTPTTPLTPTPTPTLAGGCVPDTYEVDDICSQAKPIPVTGAVQQHNFHSSGNEDWVYFDVTGGTQYTIETSNLGANVDTFLRLYAPDCTTQLAWDDDGGAGYASKIVYVAPDPGRLRVQAYELYGRGDCGSYDLSVSEGPPTPTPTPTPPGSCVDDAYEENDSCGLARAMNVGLYQDLHVCPGDPDFYYLYLEAGDTLTASAWFSHAAGDLDMELYRYDCAGLHAVSTSGTDNEQIQYSLPQAQNVVLKVFGADPSVQNEYDLELRVLSGTATPTPTPTATPTSTATRIPGATDTPTPTITTTSLPTATPTATASATPLCFDDRLEDNDNCSQQRALLPGTYPGLRICREDEDYFGVDVRAGETMTFTVRFLHALGDIDIRLLRNACQEELQHSSSTTDDEIVNHTASSDDHLTLRVYPWSESVENDYDLEIEVWPPREPHRIYLPLVLTRQ